MTNQPPVMPGDGSQPIWPPQQTPPPPHRNRKVPILIGALVALVIAVGALAAVYVGSAHGAAAKPAGTTAAALPQDPCGGGICNTSPTADATTAASSFTAADIRLTVHITKKDCFGSAGCNVEYRIKAAIGADPQECEVTYDVHGLEDTQTGTLDFHGDGTYEQDSYQSGETSSSSKKLTAKVTDVEC